MKLTFFCPYCWREIKDVRECPFCHKDIKEFSLLSYDEKLIMALKHPLKEIRRNIIFIIGKKRLEMALPHLENIIFNDQDFIIIIEALIALKRIGTAKAKEILERAKISHHSPLIKRFVENLR